MSEQLSKAAQYRQMVANREIELVDVTLPSGAVHTRIKPNKFALLFGLGELPQYAASEAAKAWQEAGLIKLKPDQKLTENEIKAAKKVFELRDKVFENSHDPKLVKGEAKNENELSTDEVLDIDLEYLMKYEAAGGDAAIMAVNFPEKSGSSSMAGQMRPGFRQTSKRAGRNKR